MKAQRAAVKKPIGAKSSRKSKPKKKKKRPRTRKLSMMAAVLEPLAEAAEEILARMRR